MRAAWWLVAGGAIAFVAGILLPLIKGRPRVSVARDRSGIDGRIAVVIAAYLESSVIGSTVRRLRMQLDSSGEFDAEIIVVASDEDTARAARDAGANVLSTRRSGKAAAINAGVAHASTAEIVVLSDANCEIVPDLWPQILRTSLSRADLISATKREQGGNEASFWKLEKLLKARPRDATPTETLAVVGEFLAFRAADFEPLATRVLVDDLVMAMSFARRGLTVQVSPEIETTEPATTGRDQWGRRVRIARGQLVDALPEIRELLSTHAGFNYVLHKLYRLTVGVAGFWVCWLGFALIALPWSPLLAVLLIAASVGVYSTPNRLPAGMKTVAAAISLQLVPPLAAMQVGFARLKGNHSDGWKKVAR